MTTRVALVTGAARGIGRAVALRLAEDGLDVAVNDLPDAPGLDDVMREIESKGRRSIAIPADVSLEAEVVRIIQQVVQKLGSLDVMVANAAIMMYQSFLDTTVDSFDRVMTVNARSTMLCYKYAANQMIAQGRGGRIIGACSAAGKKAGAGIAAAYCASKFAIRGLTQAAAHEFGKHGITVNAYAPGMTDTQMSQGPLPKAAVGTPIQHIAAPGEIAALASYLAAESSGFITGT
ncbi:hypothetical protein BJV77DRAFT_938693 [Russula vinacea]|nr:hypothetical protein BJV77DRAFT_938693 [Russula vinacea]